MIDLNKANSTAYFLYQQLLSWGLKEEDFQIENKDSAVFVRKTISAKKNGISFRVILYLKEVSDHTFTGVNSLGFSGHSIVERELKIVYLINNPEGIELSLRKKSFKHKIRKWLGKNKLEIYSHLFDENFLIECNHEYAYIDILEENIQKKLLSQAKHFSQYLIEGEQVRSTISFEADFFEKNETYFIALMEIGLLLAQNVQNWQPPK